MRSLFLFCGIVISLAGSWLSHADEGCVGAGVVVESCRIDSADQVRSWKTRFFGDRLIGECLSDFSSDDALRFQICASKKMIEYRYVSSEPKSDIFLLLSYNGAVKSSSSTAKSVGELLDWNSLFDDVQRLAPKSLEQSDSSRVPARIDRFAERTLERATLHYKVGKHKAAYARGKATDYKRDAAEATYERDREAWLVSQGSNKSK